MRYKNKEIVLYIRYETYSEEKTIYRKIYKRHQKSVVILSDTCKYKSRITLALVNILYFYISQ